MMAILKRFTNAGTKPSSFVYALAAALLLLPAATLQAQEKSSNDGITAQDQHGIDGDIARHFGDAPANPGPKARLSGAMKSRGRAGGDEEGSGLGAELVSTVLRSHLDVERAVHGVHGRVGTLDDAKYRDAMETMAEKFAWQLRSEVPNADDQSVGQTYLELDLENRRRRRLPGRRKHWTDC